ncbi:MAG: toprim domain-containing protein, partial [Thermomicrobiales bacterium]
LRQSPQASERLRRERGLRDPLVLGLGIAHGGLAPAAVQGLRAHGLSSQRITEALTDAGVFSRRTGNYRLGRRLLIPAIANGETIYYQARSLDSDGAFKYLNPPDLPRPLFGIETLARDNQLVWIGEGPFDVLPLIEAGQSAVAGMGSDITREATVALAAAIGPREAIVIFDNDRAGLTKGAELADNLRKHGCQVAIMPPPDGVKDYGEWAARDGVAHVIADVCWSLPPR